MKTNTLMPLGVRGVLIAGVIVAVFASVVMFAHADTAPTVNTTAYNSSNMAITAAPIGSSVLLTATIASSSTTTLPTGTVTFSRYANTSCSGTPTTQAGVTLMNGVATSSTATMSASGLSYIATYGGDGNNTSAGSACRVITAQSNNPTLTLGLSNSSVYAGSSVNASSTLGGLAANAGGSVAYNVYSDNSCNNAWQSAGSHTVSSGIVPNSDTILFSNAGTYYWRGVYSGDANNTAATSSCVALSVLATTTPVTPTSTPGTISGKVYNDANQNDKLDSNESGLAGFTINLYKGAGWWGKKGLNDPIQTVVTDSNGNYVFNNLANGTYSVEQIKKNGWKQTSDDYRSLTIKNGVGLANINFSDVAKATTTPSGNHNGDNDHDADDQGTGTSTGNGNHWGWFNFWSRFGNLPWGHSNQNK